MFISSNTFLFIFYHMNKMSITEIRVFLLFGLKANEEFCSMKKSWRKHKRCLIYTCSITRGRGTCIEPPLSLERELTLLLLIDWKMSADGDHVVPQMWNGDDDDAREVIDISSDEEIIYIDSDDDDEVIEVINIESDVEVVDLDPPTPIDLSNEDVINWRSPRHLGFKPVQTRTNMYVRFRPANCPNASSIVISFQKAPLHLL
ncbi:hypothetical protein LINPERPRIM_LOCUS40332 [Linum perenne]